MKTVLGSRALFYSVMVVLTAFYGVPLLWMLASTFKENREIFSTPLSLPTSIDFSSWAKAWEIGNIGRYAFNSAFVTSSSVIVILLFASLAAFGFSRFRFPGKKGLLVVFGIGLLMPLQSYFIAQNLLFEGVEPEGPPLDLDHSLRGHGLAFGDLSTQGLSGTPYPGICSTQRA